MTSRREPRRSGCSSTKGAMETLTRAWAAEFGPAGVRVNAISPGVIRAPTLDGSGAEKPEAEIMMRGTPAGDSGTPSAVAHAAVYLASDDAAFLHATVIDVDGGRAGVSRHYGKLNATYGNAPCIRWRGARLRHLPQEEWLHPNNQTRGGFCRPPVRGWSTPVPMKSACQWPPSLGACPCVCLT